MKSSIKNCSAAVSLAFVSATFSTSIHASGFALLENSASGSGNAFAGAAAIAEDASTIWFNPAGMTKLSGSRIALVGHVIAPQSDFTNVASTAGSLGQNAGVTKFVPNFYYIHQLNNDVTFGLGINAPFGLETDYSNDTWAGRYHATQSEMITININPALAFKASDKLSIGVGFNYQLIDVTLANKLDAGAICLGMDARGFTGLATACANAGVNVGDSQSSQSLRGDDISWGINFGILYDFNDTSRMGIAYRSGVNHDLEGNVDFTMNSDFMDTVDTYMTLISQPAYTALFNDTAIAAHVELPDTLSFSFVHNLDSAITLLADATLTRWKSFDQLKIQFDNPVQADSVTPENWENTWRVALGANYKANDTFVYRVGVALDQTPVGSPEERTARIPDNDRTWLSLGLGYALDSAMSIDVGYSHLFVDDTAINNTDVASGHVLNGTYENSVDILSAQLNMKF